MTVIKEDANNEFLTDYENSKCFYKELKKYIESNDIFIVCIGTDRVSGDSFGPFVGNYLTELGYSNVLGTIDNPVHASNFLESINNIPKDKIVIAIDSSFGYEEDIGNLVLKSGPLRAGSGVGKYLPFIGDFTIKGIVTEDTGDINLNHISLYNVRLSKILKMAKKCAESISLAFPLDKK